MMKTSILRLAHRQLKKALCLSMALAALTSISVKPAQACGPCLDCSTWQNAVSQAIANHETWFQNTFWQDNFLPAMRRMTDQFTQAMMLHARMIGGFMDAQNHLRSQLALQEMTADALKSYTPSDSVCQFGTLSRSLAASQAKSRNVQMVLSERSQARQLGKPNNAGSKGMQEDHQARLAQFQGRFCDVQDNNAGMTTLCGASGGSDKFHNLDINYTRTIDTKPTLDIDFTNATPTDDERDVIAMASNLYSHDLAKRFATSELKDPSGNKDNRTIYMDMRSIIAKRNVAEHSFNTMVGMKAAGTKASRDYVFKVLKNLGMTDADAQRFFGDTITTGTVAKNPSYAAQMEILTKKLYQDPSFYANLMDKPANVQRQYAAMQSFGLMQQRDVFETVLRSEMLLSLIVELEVSKYQDEVQNRMNTTVR